MKTGDQALAVSQPVLSVGEPRGGKSVTSPVARPSRRHRLGRRLRVLKSRDFQAVRAKGRKHVTPAMVVQTWMNTRGHTRLGLVAAKKTLPRAVDRNRAKRLVREGFRLVRERMPAGWDVVAIVRAPVLNTPVSRIAADFADVARRMRGWAREEAEIGSGRPPSPGKSPARAASSPMPIHSTPSAKLRDNPDGTPNNGERPS